MPDLQDGQSAQVQGSARLPYVLKNIGGVYSCTCPAWRNQSLPIERRTCKHLRQYRGEAVEAKRLAHFGSLAPISAAAGPTKAPAVLLAESWDGELDPTGWLLSEKLDGVRAYWDGAQFLSRQGNKFHAPDWFVAELPDVPLDGELWLARKAFQRTVSIVRRQDQSEHWRQLRYVVFDAPAVDGPFEKRLEKLRELISPEESGFVRVLPQFDCRGRDHLLAELERINALGGEGVMLREPGSRYEARRSGTLLKVKTFRDGEARVIEHLAGAGRHKGRLGSLAVELPDGTRFSVGSGFTDAQREHPPTVGSIITFRYQELTDGGVPRFPTFVRVRSDAHWNQPLQLDSATFAASQPTVTVRKETISMTRRFEFVEGSSAKFYEVHVSAKSVTVRFGRLGTDGQTQTKQFDDAAAAQQHADKLIKSKTSKGYQEVSLASR